MQARSRIAVAGATGRVGRHLVKVLKSGGHEVVAISRSGGVDVITGVGLEEALAGVECVAGAAGAAIPEIAGPREEDLVGMARLLVTRRGDRLRVEGTSDPDDPDRELYEGGGLLPGPGATLAGPTLEEWLGAYPAGR
jgi:uncharacterized protein YbjT (DUF2867 family)